MGSWVVFRGAAMPLWGIREHEKRRNEAGHHFGLLDNPFFYLA
jgi:hypothetical protein